MKGWIALDIDGTITLDKYKVPDEVVSFLRKITSEGWKLVLATGRPYAFASMALGEFDFPYSFLAQNGSAALQMPDKEPLFTRYIDPSKLPLIEAAYEGIESDFLIYAGFEKGDFCYYRPHRFSADELIYLSDLQKRQKESWREVTEFKDAEIGAFPLVKCFGFTHQLTQIADRLRATQAFNVAHIRDPYDDAMDLLLVTDRTASKGLGLAELLHRYGKSGLVIAAGDDENDLSLFDVADVKIAMPHAPASLHERADFIAPPTAEQGIIRALKMVFHDHHL
ncbi:MAG: HAD family phosphatase [Verrucomicrobiota bacterium]|nr:HAD family phosphatase [Verrucomicrobiota bacterium]